MNTWQKDGARLCFLEGEKDSKKVKGTNNHKSLTTIKQQNRVSFRKYFTPPLYQNRQTREKDSTRTTHLISHFFLSKKNVRKRRKNKEGVLVVAFSFLLFKEKG